MTCCTAKGRMRSQSPCERVLCWQKKLPAKCPAKITTVDNQAKAYMAFDPTILMWLPAPPKAAPPGLWYDASPLNTPTKAVPLNPRQEVHPLIVPMKAALPKPHQGGHLLHAPPKAPPPHVRDAMPDVDQQLVTAKTPGDGAQYFQIGNNSPPRARSPPMDP